MPTVSVIMPVYKVERFVERAVRSMLSQTLTDFELLAVDDGSPDQSGAILDRLAQEDARVTVFHQPNAGAPAARNRAIARAAGKYLYFMDADDWAEPTMLADMVEFADQHDLQLAVAAFFIDTYYDEDRFVREVHRQPGEVFESQRAFRENAFRLFDANLLYPPWNKLFRADYLRKNGILFPETFWDDFPFVLAVVRDVERVGVLDTAYYHFLRARQESETARYRADMYEKREEEHGWMLELYDHWDVHDPGSQEMVQRRYIERVVGCIENVASPACTLSGRGRREEIARILANPRVGAALSVARPRSFYMKLMLLPVRTRLAGLCLLEVHFIGFVKRRSIKTFAKLKAGR